MLATLGSHRQNMQWIDLLHYIISTPGGGGGAAINADALEDNVRIPIELMQIYSETASGVHLHEVVPGWLLVCLRPDVFQLQQQSWES